MPVQENASRFIRQSCLLEILQKYGAVTPVGSYRMQVMVWNDLDLYMDTADLTPDKYYRLTADGLEQLEYKEKEWKLFSRTVNAVLGYAGS